MMKSRLPKCLVCGGMLKPKIEFFKQGHTEKEYQEIKKRFKKEIGEEFPEPTGYNCIVCGRCYDEHFNEENYSIGWLRCRMDVLKD